ncbi:MAG: tetratricopeptide repeat protein [Thermosynechococcaceae cyanobacterium]
MFIGWLNGWFSGLGFSLQASAPAHTSADYQVRGVERIKNPFAWDEGVEDIRTAIRLETDKQYIATGYSALAEAYARKGDKDKALQYLQTALRFAQESSQESKTEVDRNAGYATGEITKIFIQRYIQSGYKRWW